MAEALIILVLLIASIPIVFAYNIAQSIRRAHEEKFVFKGTIDPIRALFLFETFGLLDTDLQALHFDGKQFHLQGKLRHFSEFSSIIWLSYRDDIIINPALPHVTTWRYMRVTGEPDRRYRNNPATMSSTKLTFRLEGQIPGNLVTYSISSYDEIGGVVEKFNRFLGLARKYDLEKIIKEYTRLMKIYKKLEDKYVSLTRRKAEVDAALEASLRLVTQNAISSDTLRLQEELRQEQAQLNSDAKEIQGKIFIAVSELEKRTQKVKDWDTLQRCGKLI